MGFKIKEVRKSLKMSQEELAEKSGVSRGTIVALESGSNITGCCNAVSVLVDFSVFDM